MAGILGSRYGDERVGQWPKGVRVASGSLGSVGKSRSLCRSLQEVF